MKLHHYHQIESLEKYKLSLLSDYESQLNNYEKEVEQETRKSFREEEWEYNAANKTWYNLNSRLTLKLNNFSGQPSTIQRVIDYHKELILPNDPEEIQEEISETIYGFILCAKAQHQMAIKDLETEQRKKKLSSIGDPPKFLVVIPQ